MCYISLGDRMKLLFISDIHGIKTNLEKIREIFEKENCGKLVVLGDLFYIYKDKINHKDYDPKYVEEFLNSFKDNIICVRGNCDSEEDLNRCLFPIKDIDVIRTEKEDLYITHGHIYNQSNWDKTHSILIFGHYHTPFIIDRESNTYINPGSISLPRNDIATYLIYDEEKFIIYDIENNIVAKKNIA